MTVDEARRHSLGVKAREVFGVGDGETLMEMLPPVGWADVATKHDLALLRAELTAEFRHEINRLIFWLVPLLLAYGAALVRFG